MPLSRALFSDSHSQDHLRTQQSFQAEASSPLAAQCYRTTECQRPEALMGKLRPGGAQGTAFPR